MTPQERATRWEALKLAVGHSHIAMGVGTFFLSLGYWQRGSVSSTKQWSIQEAGDFLCPLVFKQKSTVLIQGDCQANLSLADGALVHIQGDLAATISVAGQCEIVIGGDITPGAGIEAEGITRAFVGGDVKGAIRSTGCLKVSVNGNIGGRIGTGDPRTDLRVKGNFTGELGPTQKASLVFLAVHGFMPFAALESIAQHGYTLFKATIAASDRSPGIYPEPVEYRRLADKRSHYCWAVHGGKKTKVSGPISS